MGCCFGTGFASLVANVAQLKITLNLQRSASGLRLIGKK